MKIKNENKYNIMYGLDLFLNAGEVKDVEDAIAKKLLNHPNVVKFIEEKDVEELKEKLALAEAKEKATKLGIEFSPNIGLKKLLERIAEAEEKKDEE